MLKYNRPQIVTLDDYKEYVGAPHTQENKEQDKQLTNWINMAQDYINAFCGGLPYVEYPNLLDKFNKQTINQQEMWRVNCLEQAILLVVEIYVDTGHKFTDMNVSVQNSNAPFNLDAKSSNANVEAKRVDILRLLVSGGWYVNIKESRIGDECLASKKLPYDEIADYLSQKFLLLNGNNYPDADKNFNWNSGSIYNINELSGLKNEDNTPKAYLRNFILENCSLSFENTFDPNSVNVVSWADVQKQNLVHTLKYYVNNADAQLVDFIYVNYQVNRLEGLIQAATPEGYDELVKQVQANTDAIGNINDVNEQQNAKINTNADNIELLNRNVVEIDYDGSMLDLNENTNPIASTTYVDEAIEANKGSNIAITYPENNSLLITDLTKGWGTSVENSGLYLHWQNNNNILGWKNVAKEEPHNLTNDFLYIEGGKVKTNQIVDANSIVNRKYVQDSAQTIGQFLSQKPIIKYVKGGGDNSGNTQGLYVYIPQSWAALPTEYWTNLYIVPVYYSTRAKNWKRGVTPRLLNARNMKLRIMTMPNGSNSDRRSPYYYLYNELWPTGRVTYLNDLKNLYIKLNNNAVGKWIRIATVDNATQPVKLSPYSINSFIFSWSTSIQKIQSMFDSDKNNWIKGRWNSGFRKHTHNNNGITKAYIEAYANVGWAFYRPSNTGSLVSGKNIFTELEALSTPTMVSMYFQAPYTSKPLNTPLYNYPQMKMTKIKID